MDQGVAAGFGALGGIVASGGCRVAYLPFLPNHPAIINA